MQPIFKTVIPNRSVNLNDALVTTSRARGISPVRVAGEILRLNLGRQGLTWKEYFLYGAHQAGLTPDDRAEFLGDGVMRAINDALNKRPRDINGLIADKLLTNLVLTRCGLPVAEIRGVAVKSGTSSPYPILQSPEDFASFLRDQPLPFFGKPVHGSRSLGAVSVVGREGDTLILGDASRATISDFTAGAFKHFAGGYLIQDLVQPHPDLARIVGPVISSVRIVTVRVGTEILPLYSAMKMPGPGQMVDDIVSLINTMCSVDLATGRIVRGQDACRLGGTEMPFNPVTGATLAGAALPSWQEAKALALNAHATFGSLSMLGTDIALTETGPRMIELNSYPHHSFYQKCFARGLWNGDIAPILTEALASAGHRKPTRKLRFP